jgi:dimethylhistidine N-methyltransferase
MREIPLVTTHHFTADASRVTLGSDFARDIRHHLTLTPRQIPSRHLYNALGSALFDAICELPWYGITRAERRMIVQHRTEIYAHVPGLTRVVELGPGDGRKLDALVGGTSRMLTAHLIDVSAGALARAARTLSDAPHVTVVTHEASFEDGLDEIRALPSDSDRTLALFLGSNIGNFDRAAAAALLGRIRSSIGRGDALLIGADLVKPERDLLLAYDDPLGVSASFNLNVLLRVNQELGGNFDLRAFHHRAVWNPALSRMEMYVVSTKHQEVRIENIGLDLILEAGEAIWTETSYKYTPEGLAYQVEAAGFRRLLQWVDRSDLFVLALFRAE